MTKPDPFAIAKQLSPRRNTTKATDIDSLVDEQLRHFAIDASSDYGKAMAALVRRMYETQGDIESLWRTAMQGIQELPHTDRIARLNAKKFVSFQLAKLLDNFQQSFRKSYQALGYAGPTQMAKGPYPIFDNITAIFSATPVITRTATYVFACAEWIEDAFAGKDFMLEIYSRLLNPTSITLANYIVDLEAGPYAADYLAWNFNSGMAAIDATMAHLLGRDDILITSRNVYGGSYQLIHDWYAKEGNLEIAVETFDGHDTATFLACAKAALKKYASRIEAGRRVYVHLESPCNPHGHVLDVPAICREAHGMGMKVMLDATVGTPFLIQPLQREAMEERPDFLIHSYTKDISGTGSVIAGCVIGRNEDMFIPKGQTVGDQSWDQTMFWNVYYVKGAFLNADAAFEVIQGMRTLDVRMTRKCINTRILAEFLAAHSEVSVNCNAIEGHPNAEMRKQHNYLKLPAPLFTVDMGKIPTPAFQRFFDLLSPMYGHMVSLGQSNTIVSCPALTTHSELNEAALRDAGLSPTTIRFAIGDEDPWDLINHLVAAARVTIDPEVPEFSDGFPSQEATDRLIHERYVQTHRDYIEERLQHRPPMR